MTRLLQHLSSSRLSVPERVVLVVGALAATASLILERIANG